MAGIILLAFGGSVFAAESSPSVDELVRLALDRAPALRAAADEVAAARAGGSAAAALQNPELELEAGRREASDAGASARGAAWGARLAIPVEWPGRRTLRRAVAEGDLAAAEIALASLKAEVRASTIIGATRLAAAQRQGELARRRATRLNDAWAAIKDRPAATPAVEVDRLTIGVAFRRARADARAAEAAVEAAWRELDALVHLHAERPPDISLTVLTPTGVPDPAKLQAAAGNAFAPRTARAELARREAEQRLVGSDSWSIFSVAPFYERAAALGTETTVGVGLALPLPVLSRNRGGVRVAAARTNRARREVEQAEELSRHRTEVLIGRIRAAAAACQELSLEVLDEMDRLGEFAARQFAGGRIGVQALLTAEGEGQETCEQVLRIHVELVEAREELSALTEDSGVGK